jgi:hypothetical protein
LKRIVIIAASAGAGFALVITLVIAGIWWFQSLPKRWDERGITASFDNAQLLDVDALARQYGGVVEGKNSESPFTLVLHYTVANSTTADYRLTDNTSAMLFVKRGANLTSGGDANGHYPLFIPAGQRVDFTINYVFSIPDPFAKYGGRMLGQGVQKAFADNPSRFIQDHVPQLNGFALFDESHRVHIDFPKGW